MLDKSCSVHYFQYKKKLQKVNMIYLCECLTEQRMSKRVAKETRLVSTCEPGSVCLKLYLGQRMSHRVLKVGED